MSSQALWSCCLEGKFSLLLRVHRPSAFILHPSFTFTPAWRVSSLLLRAHSSRLSIQIQQVPLVSLQALLYCCLEGKLLLRAHNASPFTSFIFTPFHPSRYTSFPPLMSSQVLLPCFPEICPSPPSLIAFFTYAHYLTSARFLVFPLPTAHPAPKFTKSRLLTDACLVWVSKAFLTCYTMTYSVDWTLAQKC